MTIFKHSNDRFTVVDQVYNEKYECSDLKELISLTTKLQIKPLELEVGLTEMIRNGHNAAEFGDINLSFMFTKEVLN